MKMKEEFTKYEIARVLGARALQIAMDAPLLLKISDEDLKAMHYDALKIAEKELSENVLPISIDRPMPNRKEGKIKEVKEEKIEDSEIIAKEIEVEKEIEENADELGFVAADDEEPFGEDNTASEEQ